MNDIIFPKEIQEALLKHFDVSKEDAISEIYFATAATNTLTNKLTFTKIFYEVIDSNDLEIHIFNDSCSIDFGEQVVNIHFKTPFKFSDDQDVVINKQIDTLVV